MQFVSLGCLEDLRRKWVALGYPSMRQASIGHSDSRHSHEVFQMVRAFAVSPSFPQQQNFAMGSLAQISSGAIRCSLNTRFWARFRRVPEGSGADTC